MAKPTSLRVILIRSGSTSWDMCGRVSGSADHPMCDEGAAALAEAIRAFEFGEVSLVLHGPDDASRATGELVGSLTRAKVKSKDRLGEVGMGLWEGLLPADLEDRYPTVYAKWLEDPTAVSVPDGEPVTEADARLRSAILKGTEKVPNNGTVVLVLRPIAWALMRCRLAGEALTPCWEAARAAPQLQPVDCDLAALQDAGPALERTAARA